MINYVMHIWPQICIYVMHYSYSLGLNAKYMSWTFYGC